MKKKNELILEKVNPEKIFSWNYDDMDIKINICCSLRAFQKAEKRERATSQFTFCEKLEESMGKK